LTDWCRINNSLYFSRRGELKKGFNRIGFRCFQLPNHRIYVTSEVIPKDEKLTLYEWARRKGLEPHNVVLRWKAGKLPGLTVEDTGNQFVVVRDETSPAPLTYLEQGHHKTTCLEEWMRDNVPMEERGQYYEHNFWCIHCGGLTIKFIPKQYGVGGTEITCVKCGQRTRERLPLSGYTDAN
jgi:hypothetical protein